MPGIWEEIDVRVIDQRIGVGVAGFDTVIRVIHKPSGIIIEMPRTNKGTFFDRGLCVEMLEFALAKIGDRHD